MKVPEPPDAALSDELDPVALERLVAKAIRDVKPGDIRSPALRRLLEDVRERPDGKQTYYNRWHNRHNRGP